MSQVNQIFTIYHIFLQYTIFFYNIPYKLSQVDEFFYRRPYIVYGFLQYTPSGVTGVYCKNPQTIYTIYCKCLSYILVCSQMDPLELLRWMNVEIFSYFVKGGIRPVRPMNIWKSLLQTNQNLVCQYKSRCALHEENTDGRNYRRPSLISDENSGLRSQIQIFSWKRVQIGRT